MWINTKTAPHTLLFLFLSSFDLCLVCWRFGNFRFVSIFTLELAQMFVSKYRRVIESYGCRDPWLKCFRSLVKFNQTLKMSFAYLSWTYFRIDMNPNNPITRRTINQVQLRQSGVNAPHVVLHLLYNTLSWYNLHMDVNFEAKICTFKPIWHSDPLSLLLY